jgi:hypothetical protein
MGDARRAAPVHGHHRRERAGVPLGDAHESNPLTALTGKGAACSKHAMVVRRATLAALLLVLSADPAAAGPEMELDVGRIEASVRIETEVFHPPSGRVPLDSIAPVSGNCVLDPSEDCVGGPGIRKLLRFDALIHNRGDEDLVLGDPALLPEFFEFSECHGHYHFAQASLYELVDENGALVAPGRKQGFCLEDTVPSSQDTRTGRRYHCGFQGLQVGWADLYPQELDCQWIDVTDVPPGDYTLHVAWNPQGLLEDGDPTNNEAFVPVRIEAPESAAPTVSRIWRPAAFSSHPAGRTMFVQWSAADDAGIVSQEVWFSPDDGGSWEQLVGDLDGDVRWFAWTIPAGVSAARARIRVVARDGETQKGVADTGPFRVWNHGRGGRVPVRRR